MNKFNKYLLYISGINFLLGVLMFNLGFDAKVFFVVFYLPTEILLGYIFLFIPSLRKLGQALILSSIVSIVVGLGVCTVL